MKIKDLFPPMTCESAKAILFIDGNTIKGEMNALYLFLNDDGANATVINIEVEDNILKIWAETGCKG